MENKDYNLLLHSRVFADLSHAVNHGRVVHAYLILAPDGAGKKSLARLMCAAFLCREADKPCLQCNECRRALTGAHADIHVLRPSKKSISVQEIRTFSEEAALSSYEGGRRMFVIEQADTMTVQAQNALLKTLEEPEEGTVFLLLAQNAQQMLSTVRSRCCPVRIPEFTAEEIERQLRLHGAAPEEARRAAAGSMGVIGRAVALLGSKEYEAQFAAAQEILRMCREGAAPAQVSALLNAQKERIAPLLELLCSLLSQQLSQQPSAETLARLYAAEQMQLQLKGNINFALAADMLAISLIKGETVWQKS